VSNATNVHRQFVRSKDPSANVAHDTVYPAQFIAYHHFTFDMSFRDEFLGRRVLYHATNTDAGSRIFAGGVMLSGRCGMYGAGIYFAETREIARYKSARDGGRNAVMIEAEVDLGNAFVVEDGNPFAWMSIC
jgi:hypothetical protein